jgi:hypothetical protein
LILDFVFHSFVVLPFLFVLLFLISLVLNSWEEAASRSVRLHRHRLKGSRFRDAVDFPDPTSTEKSNDSFAWSEANQAKAKWPVSTVNTGHSSNLQ